eukprot:SAG31_NODE_46382_length_254_cov_1.658065_1_plen_55_part_01
MVAQFLVDLVQNRLLARHLRSVRIRIELQGVDYLQWSEARIRCKVDLDRNVELPP